MVGRPRSFKTRLDVLFGFLGKPSKRRHVGYEDIWDIEGIRGIRRIRGIGSIGDIGAIGDIADIYIGDIGNRRIYL
jgi:hypothetical protein